MLAFRRGLPDLFEGIVHYSRPVGLLPRPLKLQRRDLKKKPKRYRAQTIQDPEYSEGAGHYGISSHFAGKSVHEHDHLPGLVLLGPPGTGLDLAVVLPDSSRRFDSEANIGDTCMEVPFRNLTCIAQRSILILDPSSLQRQLQTQRF